MKHLIPFEVIFQYHLFKKPGGMTQMPFRWAYIYYGLNHKIFFFEGFTKDERLLSDPLIFFPEVGNGLKVGYGFS